MCVLAVVACGQGDTDTTQRNRDVPATVALGGLPEPFSDPSPPPVPPTTVAPTSVVPSTPAVSEAVAGEIADLVVGYRVLLIGDTVLSRTAPRNDGTMCDVLADFGWTVEVDAEPGRFIEFGGEVLDQRLEPADGEPWDVVGLMLGHHFDGDIDGFVRQLGELLDRLSPRPILLYTVSELDADAIAINEVIRASPRSRPNVVVIDWAEVTALDPDRMFEDEGPDLSRQGGEVLVLHTASALGRTPRSESGARGACLPTAFVDDSAILL